MRRSILLGMILVLPLFSVANLTPEELDLFRLREAKAIFINGEKLTIDGIIDEVTWQKGSWQGGFIQRDPNDGSPETYRTEFCVLYDNDYLYVGARAYDPEPEKIIALLTRRDNYTESDWM